MIRLSRPYPKTGFQLWISHFCYRKEITTSSIVTGREKVKSRLVVSFHIYRINLIQVTVNDSYQSFNSLRVRQDPAAI